MLEGWGREDGDGNGEVSLVKGLVGLGGCGIRMEERENGRFAFDKVGP